MPEDGLFGIENLPYGVFSTAERPGERRLGVRHLGRVLDLGAAAAALGAPHAELLTRPSLNPLLAAGPAAWRAVRARVQDWLSGPDAAERLGPFLRPLGAVRMHLPFEVADYVDFYASEHHAAAVGRILRPQAPGLPPNWKHLPIGYHGRAGSVQVSGSPVVRPHGQGRPPRGAETPAFGPTRRLDFEAEVGFVVGVPSAPGTAVPQHAYREHVFGLCLLNDWSARDIQGWEYVPLGPFLGKSFATSLAAWVTPLDALEAARVPPPPRTHPPLPYLDDAGLPPEGLDLRLEVRLNGHLIAEPPFAAMYWTPAQQLAHLTVNGARLRTGDLYASGTVSGPGEDQRGCLLELTEGGRRPLRLGGMERTFLADGDEVSLTAWAPGPGGSRIGLAEVSGRILPAR
ncbi:fumarylacetoacetase [Streptomyces hoynatensis]|uniref:fumarylacetoacetase n=1 Tax=Streptomyces hoynatensis TaxID=1141874 RepID=A0A3A9YVS1_9ACTN|nr:fumarylacetoacetase [Streptomyces hoynatensis]RKN39306.1 fumarylacetoacetase [Streptomyces hoynatensis]